MAIKVTVEIECDPESELVARTLYAYNSYPGRKHSDIPWPPKLRQTLVHYVKLGQAVVNAQRESSRRAEE